MHARAMFPVCAMLLNGSGIECEERYDDFYVEVEVVLYIIFKQEDSVCISY